MTRLLLMFASVFVFACTYLPPPVPEAVPIPGPDGGGTIADCPAACATIAELKCFEHWGIDMADGACMSMCEDAERTPGDSMCPALVATAVDCDEANRLSQCE